MVSEASRYIQQLLRIFERTGARTMTSCSKEYSGIVVSIFDFLLNARPIIIVRPRQTLFIRSPQYQHLGQTCLIKNKARFFSNIRFTLNIEHIL